jgi:mono/diheme cytochrome c family protein
MLVSATLRQRTAWMTLGLFALLAAGQVMAQEKITFDDHIKPLFRARCAACHNPDKKNGDLDVTNYTSLMLGGGSGEVVSPGDVGGSYLFALVNHDDEPAMPPDSPRIPDAEITLLSQWIEQGALENKSSKAKMSNKPKVAALDASPLERPEVVASPAHLSLQPANVVSRANAALTMHTSPWAPVMALAGPGQVQLYHTDSRELTGILDFPEGIVNVLRFSRNGSLLMGAGGRPGAQGIVAIWDLQSGQRLATLDEEIDAILTADISPDQQKVFVGGPQKMVRVYSTATDELLFEVKKHTEWLTAGEFSPDGVLLATADRNGGVHIWETFTGREYLTLAGHGSAVTGLSWRVDSNVLASTSEDGTVKLWEMENGGQVRSWNAHGGGSQSVEFTRDGRLVTTGRDRTGKLWDQGGQQLVAFGGLADIGTSATHCDETNQVVVGDWAGNVIVFAADGKEVGRLEVTPPSLETRLSLAENALGEVQAKLTPEVAKKKEMDTQLATLEQKMTAATQDQTVKTKMLEEAKVAQGADEKALAAHNAQSTSLTQAIATLEKAIPGLQQGQAKLAEALAASPEDSELKKLAESATTLFQARQQALVTSKTKAEEVKQKMVALTKAIQDRKTTMDAWVSDLGKLATAMEEMQKSQVAMSEQVAKQNEVVATVQQEFSAAQSQVNRWKAEVQFVAKMSEFQSQSAQIEADWEAKAEALATSDAALAEVSQQLKAKTEEIKGLEGTLVEQQNALAELVKAGQNMQQQMEKGDVDAKAVAASHQKMTQGVNALGDAVKNASAALELAGEDQELAAAVKQLADLQNSKQNELSVLAEQMAAGVKAMETLKQQMTDNAAKSSAAQKVIEDLAMKLTGLKAEMADVQKDMEAKQAAVDAVNAEVEALEKRLEEIDQQRKELQGISA